MNDAPLPSSFDGNTEFYEESRWQKFSRRLKEEPLVPFGCALTCTALYFASRSIRNREYNNTNRFFRYRIYAQGFTLLCVYAGSVFYAEDRKKRREFEGQLAEKKSAEKRELWIKELEARERDELEERQRREAFYGGSREGGPSYDPDTKARKEALANMEAEERARKIARGETDSEGSSLLPVPADARRREGVAKAVLEKSEAKKSILQLVRELR